MFDDSRPRIVALNGSERPRGNTAELIDYCTELFDAKGIALSAISLADVMMVPCGPCGDCNTRTTSCAVQDDVGSVVDQMVQADGVLYGMPVHGFGTPSLMQTFIERAGVGYLRFRRPLANKVGGVIAVGRRYSHTETVSQLYHNMMLNRMILVGSGFPAIIRMEGLDSPLDDEEGISAVRAMVSRMADMIWLLRAHRDRRGGGLGDALGSDTVNERLPELTR